MAGGVSWLVSGSFLSRKAALRRPRSVFLKPVVSNCSWSRQRRRTSVVRRSRYVKLNGMPFGLVALEWLDRFK